MSKQADRRKKARIRSSLFNGEPWAILPSAFAGLVDSLEEEGLDGIESALSFGSEEVEGGRLVGSAMVIPVTSVLQEGVDWLVKWGYASSYQQIEAAIKAAIKSDSVKSIVLYCDSPGGSAIGCKRVADLVSSLSGTKPINAYVQGVCASACYYIAAACDSIAATADSMVGSIGTIYPHLEYSEHLKEIGFNFTVFTNSDSDRKKHGNAYEPLTDESKRTLQDFVDSYGESFISDVASYRGVEVKEVVEKFGRGNAIRADRAVAAGMIDRVVSGFDEALAIFGADTSATPKTEEEADEGVGSNLVSKGVPTMSERIKAQLLAFGLIASLEATDGECEIALRSWFHARGKDVPSDESAILAALQEPTITAATAIAEPAPAAPAPAASTSPEPARNEEQQTARVADLEAAANLLNAATGANTISASDVLEAAKSSAKISEIVNGWNAKLAEANPAAPSVRIVSEGRDRFAEDVVATLCYKSAKGLSPEQRKKAEEAGNLVQLTADQENLLSMPLWAIAQKSLEASGSHFDQYGDRELMAEEAMRAGANDRHVFYSKNEGREYGIRADSGPGNRPGDFPNILSSLANKFLDTITLDDDYSYPQVSAMLPQGMRDFKPEPLINRGIAEELEEIEDAGEIKSIGINEECLSYLFLQRFANKWGWTPVMIANDDLGAFVEGMIGLAEAWQVTQNRLVVTRYTSTETLLDGSALFADRADVGTAANNNLRTGGADPSDAEWGAMETLYADIGGVNTGRRVRGVLNVAFVPTGDVRQEAKRVFGPTNEKQAATDANVGIYRGDVTIVPESELRGVAVDDWYGLRNPTDLRTATVIRAYFNGYGQAGRRERWYKPENKTTYVSLEGRIAVAVKNWRYAVKNER